MPNKLILLQGWVTVITKSRIDGLVSKWKTTFQMEAFFFLSSYCDGMDNSTKHSLLYQG